MQRTARLKRQTTVNLYDPASGAVDQIKALTGLTLTTTLAGLLPAVARALDAGATWFEVMAAIEAAGQLAQARVHGLPDPERPGGEGST